MKKIRLRYPNEFFLGIMITFFLVFTGIGHGVNALANHIHRDTNKIAMPEIRKNR